MSESASPKPVRLMDDESISEIKTTPMGDAIRQFRHNKASVVALFIILFFLLLAITASLWTKLGVLDHPRGYRSVHTIRPRGWDNSNVDAWPDPGHCARDNLAQPESWCALLTPEQQLRFPDSCGIPAMTKARLESPQWCYLLGGDEQGKDWLTQTVYGTQISMAVAITGSSVSLLIGIIYGVISGYYGGRLDNVMMRFVDFLYGIPGLVIVILMQVFFREISRQYQGSKGLIGFIINLDNSMGGLFFLFIAIGLLSWIGMARLARGQVLSYREKEFVEAARAVGASDRRIIFIHLLPNIIGPLLVAETLAIPGYIFTEAFLSFIGLGVQPGVPSWGEMISRVRNQGGFGSNRHIVFVPSFALVLLTLAFNFFGDGLRDALDPRLRGR
jgi:oligopeptide transport system permease protein